MSKLKLFLITFLAALISIAAAGAVSFMYIKNAIYKQCGEPGKIKEFQIKNGESVKNISSRLQENGLILDDFVFQIYVWRKKAESKIQAGKYEIPTGANMPAILDMLIKGEIKSDAIWVTIPEGFNSAQITERISGFGFNVVDLQNLINKIPPKLKEGCLFLQDNSIKTLEGFLFPDTYEFNVNAKAEDIADKMLDNFEKKTESLKGQIAQSKMSLYEILTLSSIVEKEVSSVDDMKIVAGLFLRRLEIGMPLQSDATVNYITKKGDPTPSYKDLGADSLYNTYKYAGLPPGPICNPGINAIKAVLDPIKTEYLYFLTPAGKPTVYSRTNEEHEANKRKWLK